MPPGGAVRGLDAVVVGAGPGGAAAAALLARGGARVVVVDRSPFPRDKPCGGGLTPRGVAALRRIGVDPAAAFFVRVDGLALGAAGRRLVSGFPPTARWPAYGLVARRRDLDAAVLEVASKAGAEVRTGLRVVGPLIEDGRCRGVRLAGGAELRAPWTVAADGATSAVARGAGLAPAPSWGGFWYAALRAYFAPVEFPPPGAGRGPLLEFYPLRTRGGRWLPGYGWVFPLPGGAANVGVDLPHRPPLAGSPPLREAYEAFVGWLRRNRPGFASASPEAPPVGALLPEAMDGFRPAAPGLVAVGDAAGLITPYSGEGIAYALESAELAARAILEAARPHQAYAAALEEAYGFQFRAALAFMKAMRHPAAARLAAGVGTRSARALRAAVRVMAFLIDDPCSPSTVSRAWWAARRLFG